VIGAEHRKGLGCADTCYRGDNRRAIIAEDKATNFASLIDGNTRRRCETTAQASRAVP
jgi:hypothetical protein